MTKRRKTPINENRIQENVYSTGDVAEIFGVTRKTVASWIKNGKISAFKTPGGHNRINESEIEKLKEIKNVVVETNVVYKLIKKYNKLHFSLIDPATQDPMQAGEVAKVCEQYGTNAIMVGGSTGIKRNLVYDTIKNIKENVKIPIILFPNSAESISENTEHIFFMELLNSKETKYRGGEQAKGALLVKKWGIKCVSMGYVVVSTSTKPTTIEKRVQLDKIKIDDIEKAIAYAEQAEMGGKSCVYFEAGSGADRPISNEMIREIRNNIDIPIIIGGGITNGNVAKEKIEAGADVIVTGTIIERNKENIIDIIKKIQSARS